MCVSVHCSLRNAMCCNGPKTTVSFTCLHILEFVEFVEFVEHEGFVDKGRATASHHPSLARACLSANLFYGLNCVQQQHWWHFPHHHYHHHIRHKDNQRGDHSDDHQ